METTINLYQKLWEDTGDWICQSLPANKDFPYFYKRTIKKTRRAGINVIKYKFMVY